MCSIFLKGLFMAIGWLTVLKMVPWTDVISNAPVVAEGAKKLWKAVAKKAPTTAEDTGFVPGFASDSLEPPSLTSLQMQLLSTEAAVADLRQQMLASSELIKELAEQNTQLIRRVETNRARLVWLVLFTVSLAIYLLVTRT
jgi:hypothetical protein